MRLKLRAAPRQCGYRRVRGDSLRSASLWLALAGSALVLGFIVTAPRASAQDPCVEYRAQVQYVDSLLAQIRVLRSQAPKEAAAGFVYFDRAVAQWERAKAEWTRYCADPNRARITPPEMPDLGALTGMIRAVQGEVAPTRPVTRAPTRPVTRAPTQPVTRAPTARQQATAAKQPQIQPSPKESSPVRGALGSAIDSGAVPVGEGRISLGWVLYSDPNMSDAQAKARYEQSLDGRKKVLSERQSAMEKEVAEGQRRVLALEKYLKEGDKRLEPTRQMLKEGLEGATKDRDKAVEDGIKSAMQWIPGKAIPLGSPQEMSRAVSGAAAAQSAVDAFRNPSPENLADAGADMVGLFAANPAVGISISGAQTLRDIGYLAITQRTVSRYENAIDDVTAGYQAKADRLVADAKNELRIRQEALADVKRQQEQVGRENTYLDLRALP